VLAGEQWGTAALEVGGLPVSGETTCHFVFIFLFFLLTGLKWHFLIWTASIEPRHPDRWTPLLEIVLIFV
jgi:hypothetical protein